jgi:hypothetical protein
MSRKMEDDCEATEAGIQRWLVRARDYLARREILDIDNYLLAPFSTAAATFALSFSSRSKRSINSL